jgi:hypothetical protein
MYKKDTKVTKDFLIGMTPGENSTAGSESGESGIGIFDIVLEKEKTEKDI